MKNYLGKLPNTTIVIGLLVILFSFGIFLYHKIPPFIANPIAYKSSDSFSFIQISYPEPQLKEIPIYLIDISQVPRDQLKAFAVNDYNSPIYEQDGIKYEIVYKGNEITHLQLSPDQKRIGFYVHIPKGNTVFGQVSLAIMDFEKRNLKEINEGNLKVSNWEWQDNDTLIVYTNCGSSCNLAHVHSIKNGNVIAEYLDE